MPERSRAQQSTASLLRRFWGFARWQRRWIVPGLAMMPLVAAMSTLRPLLVKEAVDVDLASGDVLGLRITAMLFLGAVVAEFLCQAVQVYTLQRAGHATISHVRRAVFEHVLRLPNRFFDRHPIGSLLTRTTNDVEALSETMSFGVFTILTDIVIIGSILVAMFVLDPFLALVTVALAPILAILVRIFSQALRRLQLEIRKAQAVQAGYLAEQLSGITVVQLFGREKPAHDEYMRLGRRYLRATKTANIWDALLYSIMDGISAMSVALLIYFAAPGVAGIQGGVTLGLLFAFVDYMQRIFVPIREFSGKLATIQRAAASLERIYGLLDEPTEIRRDGWPDQLETWQGALRVRDLTFRYNPEGPDVLRGVSLDVEPGQVVAVVGRTGSGKSTLGRVLTRFYDGYEGSILLPTDEGDVELSTVPPDQLRRRLLMVQQDVFLFNDTVGFNVSLGQPEIRADPERLRYALRTVQADRFVQERGDLAFEVGERGSNLSAGETQLLAFARVAAREPTFLILDEATANVDSMTEQKVQAAIERLFEGHSVLVIAHRLSTIRRADQILVFDDGKIVERGTHDQLMERSGVYADLVSVEFRDQDPPSA